MASVVSHLEDVVSCPVCFDVYTKPQSLQCLHVLCFNCVQKLVKNGQLECPECRQVMPVANVKSDFNKQTLIDLYLNQTQQLQGVQKETAVTIVKEQQVCHTTPPQGGFTCENCPHTKPVSWKCNECALFMCHDCEYAHNRFPSTKEHHVKALNDIIDEKVKTIKESVALLQNECDSLQTSATEHDLFLKEVGARKIEAIEAITHHRDHLKQAIDDYHSKQIAQLENQMADISQGAVKSQTTIKGFITEMESKIAFLKDVVNEKDAATLAIQTEDIQKNIKIDLSDIRNECRTIKTPELPNIKVHDPETWDSSKGTSYMLRSVGETEPVSTELIKDAERNDFVVLRRQEKRLSDIFLGLLDEKRKLKIKKMMNLAYRPLRLHSVGETLWCTGEDGLYVYDQACKLIISLKDERIKDTTCVLQDDFGNIIAATCWKLHQLDMAGKYVRELAIGNFTDVVIQGQTMYALEFRKQEIVVFEYKKSGHWLVGSSKEKWNHSRSINLKRSRQTVTENESRHMTNICVYGDMIYVCSWENDQHSVYILHSSGQIIHHICPSDIKLIKPKICSVDSYGNALIAHQVNDGLVILDTDRKWNKVNIEGAGGLKYPADVVMDTVGHTVWIVTSDNRLIEYSF